MDRYRLMKDIPTSELLATLRQRATRRERGTPLQEAVAIKALAELRRREVVGQWMV